MSKAKVSAASASHHVVNVYIRDPQEKNKKSVGSKFSNPKSIAEKYDLDYEPSEDDEDQDRDGKGDGENEEDSIGEATSAHYDEEIFAKEFSEQHGSKTRVDDLVSKLDSKNREIERLCVLLEAVSVVPGADPGKYMQIIDGGKEEIIVSCSFPPLPPCLS
jgi:hypothetical protein